MEAMDIVSIARQTDRITTLELIDAVFDDFIELHGDRHYQDDEAVVGGLAALGRQPVTVIGHQKGRDLEENIARNFGSSHPEGYRKSLRLMKQAEKFNRPIVTFVDTAGAYCGVEAENRGQGEAIAQNLLQMSQLKVPILSIILGEGGSGGALALAAADEVWMMEYAVYSVLSPEGFSSILWKDASRAKEAADMMKVTSYDLLKMEVVERMIPEKNENGWIPRETVMQSLKTSLTSKISELMKQSEEERIQKRYDRFRKF